MEIKARIIGNELEYVKEVLDAGFRTSRSTEMMKRFETAFAKKFGARFAISQVNGTTALHSILEAIELRPGDEVIVPSLTMASTAMAVLQANATPVFSDVDPDTFLVDEKHIMERVTQKTKAIITVSLYGLAPDMDPIMQLAKDNNLFVLEDNAQGFLAEYKERVIGTIGDAATFSFQSSKHITSGEGGVIITDDSELAQNARRAASLGYASIGPDKGAILKRDIQDPGFSRHLNLGWNYRMPELCAAVALAQLENIDSLVQRRIDAARLFLDVVRDCEWLIPQKVGTHYRHSYWTFVVKLEHPDISWHGFRDRYAELGGDGIYSVWKPAYREPMFQSRNFQGREHFISKQNLESYKPGCCPNAERLQPRLLQFKTNYWVWERAELQAEVLGKTIEFFS